MIRRFSVAVVLIAVTGLAACAETTALSRGKRSLRSVSAAARLAAISRAQVWTATDVRAANIKAGPPGPDTKKHGLENPEGPHAGDMNNVMVAANGTVKTTVTDPRVSLGTGANSVFSNGGTALVIHAKADDMKTDPRLCVNLRSGRCSHKNAIHRPDKEAVAVSAVY